MTGGKEAGHIRERHSGWIRRLAADCFRHPVLVAVVGGSSAIGVGLDVIGPLLTRLAVNDAIAGTIRQLGLVIELLLALAIAQFAAAFIRRYMAGHLSLRVVYELRQAVFRSLRHLDGAQYDRLHTGQVISRVNSDLLSFSSLLALVPFSLGTAVLIVMTIGAMLWLSPLLTLIVVAVVPLLMMVAFRSRRSLFAATWSAQQREANVAQHFQETTAGIRVVKGFGQEIREISRLEELARCLFAERLRVAKLRARPNATMSAIPFAGQVAVFVLGGLLTLRGELGIGSFLAFMTYMTTFTAPARLFSSLIINGQITRAAAERIYELIDLQPNIREEPCAAQVPEGPLELRFDKVCFSYSQDRKILDEVSLHLNAGEIVALAGPSGSGKTAISLLINRFYDVQSGAVRVESPSVGADIRDLKLSSLRTAVGTVFEDALLFSGSIRDNIAYGPGGYTDEEVKEAARQAQIDDFISSLPGGYDAVVGERGHNLSGGQRQRITLARALIRNPRILVLDDATSAVDSETEAAILSSLRTVAAGRTTLLISHRLSTLAIADRVVLLDAGRIVEEARRDGIDSSAWSREIQSLINRQDERRTSEPGYLSQELSTSLWPPLFAQQATLTAAFTPVASDRGMQLLPSAVASAAKALPDAVETPALGDRDIASASTSLRLASLLSSVAGTLAIALAFMSIDAFATAALPLLIRSGVDAGVSAHVVAVIWRISAIASLLVLADWVALVIWPLKTMRAGETQLYELRVRSYAHLLRLDLEYFERELSGRIMTRMTTDLDTLSNFLQSGSITLASSFITVFGLVTVISIINIHMALLTAAFIPVIVVATAVFRRRSSVAYREARERLAAINSHFQECVSGMQVIQAYGAGELMAKVAAQLSDGYRLARLKGQFCIALYFPFLEFVSDLAQIAVLGLGAAWVARGTLSPGALVALVLVVSMFFTPIQQLPQTFDQYQQARVGFQRIVDLLRTPIKVSAPEHPVPICGRLRGDIRFDQVSFRYPESTHYALDRISLHILPGQTVAIVGATGSGKSTLIKLVARFYDPSDGSVTMDGVELLLYDPTQYRRHLGMVPQEPYLYSGDVADNIRYGHPEASDLMVEDATRAVGALRSVSALEDGFRHTVTEGGRSLSAGQRQLIALSRAQLTSPDVLLLDEPTAALDEASQSTVLAAYERMTDKRTMLIVAHRLATAERADRILVLDAGRIVEDGDHASLLALGGYYARLWRQGSANYDPRGEDVPL